MENRSRVIKDIVNHRAEQPRELSKEDLDEIEKDIHKQPDSQVRKIWFGKVGEWLDYMDRWHTDEYRNEDGELIWEVNGYDSPAEWQYDKLTSGEDLDYGYTDPVY